ncbi:SDR family NAD(P)-dependent oxidoreductase [Hyphomonas johnsonii]|uniref:Short-chain dehydrogenase/reductase n=1 Tax=Hyphomonas johnsonii MHS-2 TaxID=1280950 RepID=A0A059FS61_9PROT|nr:glucose 1-dehydrogenase [Hyphomonas johnsonii]KCZ93447.1 short-chain dehydrogenase/reductase [Hyphomonas johnsonii MHS-2]
MSDLKGKTAIVTGGSRDIGRSCSIKLGEQGCNVVVNYNANQTAADETVAAIKAAGGRAIAVKGDMTRKADVDRLVAKTVKAYGADIHVLVNNVGGLVARKKLAEMDEEFFNHVMALNMNSTFLATQAVVPHMPKGSSIVNLASLAGRDGGGGGASAYSVSKGAVITFTRSMAKELGPEGIRCNALCPGMIDTTFHDTFTPDAVRRNVESSVPLRRQGHPDECAETVVFLASEKSAYITGANIDINGGMFFS